MKTEESSINLGRGKELHLTIVDHDSQYSDNPEDTWVDVEIFDNEIEEDPMYLRISGPTKENVIVQWDGSDYDDAYVREASLDFDPFFFNEKALDKRREETSFDSIKEQYELTQEELEKVIETTKNLVYEFLKEDVRDNPSQFDYWDPPEPEGPYDNWHYGDWVDEN